MTSPVNFTDPTGHWVVAFGLSANAGAFGFGAGISAYLAFDGEGNIGILLVPAYKGCTVPSASAGGSIMVSNASNIFQLKGVAVGGGGGGGEGLVIGGDLNYTIATDANSLEDYNEVEDKNSNFVENDLGKDIWTFDLFVGVGAEAPAPVDAHANVEYTTVIPLVTAKDEETSNYFKPSSSNIPRKSGGVGRTTTRSTSSSYEGLVNNYLRHVAKLKMR